MKEQKKNELRKQEKEADVYLFTAQFHFRTLFTRCLQSLNLFFSNKCSSFYDQISRKGQDYQPILNHVSICEIFKQYVY